MQSLHHFERIAFCPQYIDEETEEQREEAICFEPTLLARGTSGNFKPKSLISKSTHFTKLSHLFALCTSVSPPVKREQIIVRTPVVMMTQDSDGALCKRPGVSYWLSPGLLCLSLTPMAACAWPGPQPPGRALGLQGNHCLPSSSLVTIWLHGI